MSSPDDAPEHGSKGALGTDPPHVLRIAVVGAECTGKTTLCRQIAQRHGGLWVPEALREFVDAQGRAPMVHEQPGLMADQIAREHAAQAEAQQRGGTLVALDSAPLVTALYSRLYFDDSALLAAATDHHRRYDLTLLADTDLPWEPDGLQRDGPAMRIRFHALLVDWLTRESLGFIRIAGSDGARLAAALTAIDALDPPASHARRAPR
ncbi:MAG: ATP-binding protein [Burkholderiaceae bacterium]|nr:ATP-binding protein [Burkholderiaceae bacterium]